MGHRMSTGFPIARFFGRAGLLFARIAAVALSLALLAAPLLRPWLSVVLLILMVGYVYVRARLRSTKARRLGDLAYFSIVMLLMFIVQFVIYLPALREPVL